LDTSIFHTVKDHIIQNAPKVLYSILILVIGLLASHLVKRWLRPILDRSRIRDDILLKSFFLRAVTFCLLALTILTSLANIGIDVRTFIAGLGITGLIIGFALRDTLSNFAAGLLLLTYRPFRAGELIEVEGTQGVVEEMTIVNMQMTTTDGVRVILPNSKVWGTKITNYSLSQRRRIEITLNVREDDIEPAVNSILLTIKNDDRTLKTPPPSVQVTSVGGDKAALRIWVWTDPKNFSDLGSDIYRQTLKDLRDNEIQTI
jgi:small conductance mechanosensitive channel